MKDEFFGDMWNLIETNKDSQFYKHQYVFDFTFIKSESIKFLFKEYVRSHIRTGNKSLSTLYRNIGNFKSINCFIEEQGITSLRSLSNNDIDNLLSYLHTATNIATGKPLTANGQRTIFSTFKTIIRWGQLHMPDYVPDTEIFTGNEFRTPSKLKIDYIPDDVLAQINTALVNESNPYLKYGIIILECTGMRIGDMVMLNVDCIQTHVLGGYTISWFDHKNKRKRPPMPVKNECALAVEKLLSFTAELRKEADHDIKNKLFLYRCPGQRRANSGKIIVLPPISFRDRLAKFTRRHNIVDSTGIPYSLSAHQFRRTLGTDMLSQGTNINVIQRVLGHTDPAITKRFYADVKDKERSDVFRNIGIIGNINMLNEAAFENQKDMEWFKKHKDSSACLIDGYCTKPVVNGQVCERLLRRQKCYTCSRYVTTPEFLDVHRNHLKALESQVAEGAIYGEHYAKHFIPTIEILKIIIARLEELQDANN